MITPTVLRNFHFFSQTTILYYTVRKYAKIRTYIKDAIRRRRRINSVWLRMPLTGQGGSGVFIRGQWMGMAKRILQESLIFEILSVVEEIPEGSVATYGQIARLIGREKNARLVGKVLGMAQRYGEYPCHRVVNHQGRLAPGWPEQAILLAREGVPMKDERFVVLKDCQWDC